MDDEWLTADEVSEMTKGALSKTTLAQRRYLGLPPTFHKPTPKTVLYRRSVVEAWLKGSERTQTGEPVSA